MLTDESQRLRCSPSPSACLAAGCDRRRRHRAPRRRRRRRAAAAADAGRADRRRGRRLRRPRREGAGRVLGHQQPRPMGERDLHHRRHRRARRPFRHDRHRDVRSASPTRRRATPNVPGLSSDTRRKLNILRSGLVLPAPTTAGRRGRAQPHLDRPPVAHMASGRGTMNGKPLTGNEIEARMGTVRNPGPAAGDVDELAQQCRRADARAIISAWSRSPTRARSELGYRRHRRDVALAATTCRPDEFAALTERLWNEVKPLYDELHCFTRAGLNEQIWRPGPARDRPDPRRPARQSCGRRNGAISTTSSRRTGAGDVGYDLTELLDARRNTRRSGSSAPARASSARWASRRCRRPSGSAR